MNIKQIRGSMILLLAAIIWGIAFVSQSVGMNYVGPFTFMCARSFIGAMALIPCIMVMKHMKLSNTKNNRDQLNQKANSKMLLIGGVGCGIILCIASCFQQIGIIYTTVGKAGFITTFYIIIVPIVGIFFKRRCGLFVWIGVVFAVVGLYFLCITDNVNINKGDLLVFICALLFSFHIICIDYFSDKVDGVKLSCIQFVVAGIISGIFMFIFEKPDIRQIIDAWQPILYAGILSSGVGYTLQIIGQRDVNPTVASLIMSLESVVSVLAGLILLGQTLSTRESVGCIFMFIAIILAQLPERKEQCKEK